MTIEATTDAVLLREAAAHGLTRSMLRGASWSPVSRGLYQRYELAGQELQRLRTIGRVLPATAAWSHYTGARLMSLWLPPLPAGLPRFATVLPATTRPECDGLYVARSRARWFEPVYGPGVATLPAPLLLGQLAEDLALIDLVVAIDRALHQGWCTPQQISDAAMPYQRGVGRLRGGLALCDGRSESAYETVLRAFHRMCGFSVTPQYKVQDSQGRVVARSDLRIDGTTRLPEYDGGEHRRRDRHHDDLRREKTLARLGMDRYGYTADEILLTSDRLLRDAEEACGLSHEPRRLRRWLVEARRSSLLPEGWRLLHERLRRFDNCRTRPHPRPEPR